MPNYLPIESILADVKSDLRSFDESGQLDEASLISDAVDILNKYKLSRDYTKRIVLDVYDSRAEIPYDLDLEGAMSMRLCSLDDDNDTVLRRYYFGRKPRQYTIKDYSKELCYHKCEIHQETEWISRTLYFEEEEPVNQRLRLSKQIEFTHRLPLENIPDKPFYNGQVIPTLYTIEKKHFRFNFKEGHVILDYTGLVLDEDGYPLIEDNSYVRRALIDYLTYRALFTIFINSESDVQTRMQYMESKSRQSLNDLNVYVKLPTQGSVTKFGNRLKRKNSIKNFYRR